MPPRALRSGAAVAQSEWRGIIGRMTAERDSLPSSTATASRGCRLSALLRRVGEIIEAQAGVPVWVRSELSAVNDRGGHLYLDLVEHDDAGVAVAKARAMAWRNIASVVQAKFVEATGSRLQSGMKVLLQVRVTFHVQHGLALQVLDIEPAYTIGEMAARVQRIRQTLIAERLYERNRQLPRPKDFYRVAVIAPVGAAGLGDFKANAKHLEAAGVCAFAYFEATYQGPQAGPSVAGAIARVVGEHVVAGFDALVLIRGGGAASDLAWLNDLDIARALCSAPLPVLIGIGHERDRTLLDEIACWSFDTPSKVVGGIEHTILQRAQTACEAFQVIAERSIARLGAAESLIERHHHAVRTGASEQVHRAGQSVASGYATISEQARLLVVQAQARTEWLQRALISDAWGRTEAAQEAATRLVGTVAERADGQIAQAERAATLLRDEVLLRSAERLDAAEREARSLFSTIFSLGPVPTLERGFAIARAGGRPLTTAAAARAAGAFDLDFKDGTVHVHTEP